MFFFLQRKSSKAKEKKQKRLEERAAMDAVCAKVDAANRVTLSSSLNFHFFFFFFLLLGATQWQICRLSMQACAHVELGGGPWLVHVLREMWKEGIGLPDVDSGEIFFGREETSHETWHVVFLLSVVTGCP